MLSVVKANKTWLVCFPILFIKNCDSKIKKFGYLDIVLFTAITCLSNVHLFCVCSVTSLSPVPRCTPTSCCVAWRKRAAWSVSPLKAWLFAGRQLFERLKPRISQKKRSHGNACYHIRFLFLNLENAISLLISCRLFMVSFL